MCVLLHYRPDNTGSTHVWNVGVLARNYTVLYSRKLSYSYWPLWEPEIPLTDLYISCILIIFYIVLIDYGGVKLMSQNRGHHWSIVHPPGECEWRVLVMMTPTKDNSWLVYQSSLSVLPTKTSAAKRNGRRNESFAYSVSLICQRIFYMP
jgi:hypothetical protein